VETNTTNKNWISVITRLALSSPVFAALAPAVVPIRMRSKTVTLILGNRQQKTVDTETKSPLLYLPI
jgi:hypothetical protein